MRASGIPLNVRVTVEVQDKSFTLHKRSAPATMPAGRSFTKTDMEAAITAALELLGAAACHSHTHRLMENKE